MRKLLRRLGLLLAIVMALPGAAASAEAAEAALSLQPGDALHGFTVLEVYDSASLNSTIYTFNHDLSGAKLVYVKNDDPELAFSVGYHTPYVDETDTNHVFEHAIIASSEKYPAKDIYFDMVNQSYSTYINAHTSPTATWYPLSSMSEEQLLKLADVYMSCMVAPLILTDERIFRREAVRFELDDPEGDIAVNGTVFAEDSGCLTDVDEENAAQVLKALYPGEIAANAIGRAHEHYGDLTYENTIATYERCYHFDNSLLFLYGDLDLDRFLGFLDAEYLSKYPAAGTDLSAWRDGLTPAGFVDVQRPVPAYEGDAVENASAIAYAIDLDGVTPTALIQYDILAGLMNIIGSPLYNARLERGIENPVSVQLRTDTAKPCFIFAMSYANPEQKDALKALAEDALTRVASEGIDPEMLRMVLKSQERSSKLLRNATNVGVSLADEFLSEWVRSGDLNAVRVSEQALNAVTADGQQQLLRGMALSLLTPRRSALVTSVPTPGLAEAHDAALAQYLADMKASMTPDELAAMAEKTAAFNAWNAEEQRNNDFMISPDALPDPAAPDFTVEKIDGVTVYKGVTSLEGVACCDVYFDLSGLSREELEYLMLTSNYIGQMATDAHTVPELILMLGEYTSGIGRSLVYPVAATGDNHRPMLKINWSSLTEDFEAGLDLMLELFTRTSFRDADMLAYLTATSAESWDMSRQDGNSIANMAAHAKAGLMADTQRFCLDVDGQDCYAIISDAAKRLAEAPEYADALADQYENAIRKAFTRDNLIVMVAAPADAMDGIVGSMVKRLNALPEGTGADGAYALPEQPQSLAIGIESSMNYTHQVGDFMADPDFVGSYLPFVYALNDLYTVPTFRFQLGAYSAATRHEWGQGCLDTMVYADPNVKKTLDALHAMPEAVKDMKLTEDMLDGYILKAYGRATAPLGMINEVMVAMEYDLLGMDADRALAIKSDIRNAKPDQLSEAAAHIGRVLENAATCMTGNEALLRADADCFDTIISYRHGE
ncbi:MAG: insulinase family protein [Clostridia bacterium]|nr:insulinase family protein [Clostridia bacterium]